MTKANVAKAKKRTPKAKTKAKAKAKARSKSRDGERTTSLHTSEPTNAAFEADIAAKPEDDGLRRVYADWLISAGNPRGELAALQLADKQDEAKAFIKAHAELLLGPEIGKDKWRFHKHMSKLVWKAGFWDELHISTSIDVASAMLAHPSARLVRTLDIAEYDSAFEPAIEMLAAAVRPALRSLVIGAYSEGQAIGGEGGRSCTNLALLATAAPRLEQLTVRAADIRIGEHPSLRAFTYECVTPPPSSTLQALFAAKLPALERLSILIFDWGLEFPSVADFAPLFSGTLFPALREVKLWCFVGPLDKELRAAAAASPLARRATIRVKADWEFPEQPEWEDEDDEDEDDV